MNKTRIDTGIVPQVALVDPKEPDRPLVDRWLRAGHVRRFWGEPEPTFDLLNPTNPSCQRRIITAGGQKVGLIQWEHPTRKELDEGNLSDVPTSVVDIDILIGERTNTGRGIGTAAIRLVIGQALADPTVPFCMACPRPDNPASWRALEKAGFVRDREYDDPIFGRCLLMVLQRVNLPAD